VAEVIELSARELAERRSSGQALTLLDVRTHEEVALAAIPGALHIPMHEIRSRVADIPRGQPVVVICHHGERSRRVARFLAAAGHGETYNLRGGIDAYSLHVDLAIPRY
jgi:rhodanese-related sulfurtransferase